MTESEWLTSNDPVPMLTYLQSKVSDRKARLFAVGCCYTVWDILTWKRVREAVEVIANFSDGYATISQLEAAVQTTHRVWGKQWTTDRFDNAFQVVLSAAAEEAWDAANRSLMQAVQAGLDTFWIPYPFRYKRTLQLLTGTIRDIFGNPFSPIMADPAWQTDTVVSLSQAIYAERAFDRLPILADALEEAGCADADILAHCRSEGPHVRGCWVLDLLLGKQ